MRARAPSPAEEVAALAAAVRPARAADAAAVRRRLDGLAKPPGSLGRLEALAVRLARVYGDPPPPLRRRTVFVLAADHGVARRGVSAYPASVTGAMCRTLTGGGAAVCVLARSVGAEVVVADLGVDADLSGVPGLLHRKVRRGSRDLSAGPALTPAEAAAAVAAGAGLVRERAAGCDVVALGEMGIGNTTAATALTAALTGAGVAEVMGPGTGVVGAARARKETAVAAALRRAAGVRDPFELLAALGGLEIAGLVGVTLAAAGAGRAVVTDGFIATAAALVAARLAPPVRDHLVAGHRSTEPGHAVQLAALDLEPVLDLDLRLGEGTGAVLALPVLDAAAGLLREMATLASVLPAEAAEASTRAAPSEQTEQTEPSEGAERPEPSEFGDLSGP